MASFMDAGAEVRLNRYFERIGAVLGNKKRRESFAIYALGLFGDGERKSIEPIAARACADPQGTDAAHQRLLHFATDSPWSDRGVRREAARYALDAMTEREPVELRPVRGVNRPHSVVVGQHGPYFDHRLRGYGRDGPEVQGFGKKSDTMRSSTTGAPSRSIHVVWK